MSDDFLTQERIQRLQVMGITVWQERGKRSAPAAEPSRPAGRTEPAQASVQGLAQKAVPPPARTPDERQGGGESEAIATPDASSLDWQQLRAAVSNCRACGLCETRKQTVFGVGAQSASIMVIGEAPGAEEDQRGEPFVGRAGQLLDSMLESIGLKRSDVFIANVLKCRPPGNRDPHASEAAQCASYLQRQIELVSPQVILAVGRIASQLLLESSSSLGRLRGNVHHYGEAKVPTVVTYHPAYLLRSPQQKRKAWEDLLMSRQLIKEST